MSKAWSLRYALVRAQLGWEETLNHLTSSTASIPDAIAKGMEAYRGELTKVILFTGRGLALQETSMTLSPHLVIHVVNCWMKTAHL